MLVAKRWRKHNNTHPVVTLSGVSGSIFAGELFPHAGPPHPSGTEAQLLAAVMFWPTWTSVFHIWSCLGLRSEAECCWQATLTGHWCVFVCVRALPHLAVGAGRYSESWRALLWGHPLTTHTHTHILTAPPRGNFRPLSRLQGNGRIKLWEAL